MGASQAGIIGFPLHYLFSTLIKCKECGWSFHRTQRTFKNTYVRWTCSTHTVKCGQEKCPHTVRVPEEKLIRAMEDYFARLLANKDSAMALPFRQSPRILAPFAAYL